jgi:CrcB protein
MNWSALGLVALGGAIGSVARVLVSFGIPAGRLPWATITVNVTGSLLIGWLMARFSTEGVVAPRTQMFWVVGICGGFTTFSSFSWQTFELMQRGHWGAAAANATLSFALCFVATWLGWRLGR